MNSSQTKTHQLDVLDKTDDDLDALKVLTGKLIYLDLSNSYKSLNNVKECLSLIGAKLADCLSKDVNFVITNTKEQSRLSLTPCLINRTQSIMGKATKNYASNDIVSNAKRLGIKVLPISKLERLFEKKLKSKFKESKTASTRQFYSNDTFNTSKIKTTQLKNPFLKFESICKQYRPLYNEFDVWHELNYDLFTSKSTISPFQIYFSDDIKIDSSDENNMQTSSSSSSSSSKSGRQSNKHTKLKNITNNKTTNIKSSQKITSKKSKTVGYCECCKKKFDNLKQHLTSMQHETFERNLRNFKELDDFVNDSLNFDKFLKKFNLEKNHEISNEMAFKTEDGLITNNQESIKVINESIECDGQNMIVDDSIVDQSIVNQTVVDSPEAQTEIITVQKKNNYDLIESKTIIVDSQALEVLNDAFNYNPTPLENEIELIASQINYDHEVVKVWFCEKLKKLKKDDAKQVEASNITIEISTIEIKQTEQLDTKIEEIKHDVETILNDLQNNNQDESEESEIEESTIEEQKEEIVISYEPASVQDSHLLLENFNKNYSQKTCQTPKLPNVNIELINEYFSPIDTYALPYGHVKYDENIDYDEEVEYEMDEEDRMWLELVNEQLFKENLITTNINQDQFELIIDRFEKESYAHYDEIDLNNKTLEDDDHEELCCICLDDECVNTNAILFCDRCNLAVHQECYGVPYIPEGAWLCKKCIGSPNNEVSCVFCPNKDGAFKQTDSGQWAHVICAIWIPEVHFSNAIFLEPIVGVDKIPKNRWSLNCVICKKRNKGACIQCSSKKCCTAFHVTCAQKAGIYMNISVRNKKSTQKKKNRKRRSSSSSICSSVATNQDDSNSSLLSANEEIIREAYCERHVPFETLSPSLKIDKNSKTEVESALKKAQQLRLKKYQSLNEQRKSDPKNVPVPVLSKQFCDNILKQCLNFDNKEIFFYKIINYWTLKRISRNGQPILRRLLKTIGNKKKIENSNHMRFASIEIEKKYTICKKIRQNLEKQRLLMELVRKRERIKYDTIKLDQLITVYELNSLNGIFLQRLLDILRELDKKKIFHQPVNIAEVPNYLEVIKNPMDFNTMQTKISNMVYNSLDEFYSDVKLIINNCLLFNPLKISIYNKAAVKLKEQVATLMRHSKKVYESNFTENKTDLQVYDFNESEYYNLLNDTTENNSFNVSKENSKIKCHDFDVSAKSMQLQKDDIKLSKQILGENSAILNNQIN